MRDPDLIIGPRDNPQTLRWHLLKIGGWQLALHKWLRSDEDRALHDHRADNISFILSPQGYDEIVGWEDREWSRVKQAVHTVFRTTTLRRRALWLYFRKAEDPHRVVLRDSRPVWSLWLRWPARREWGFWCPKGWRTWQDFCNSRDYSAPGSTSEVGRGCD